MTPRAQAMSDRFGACADQLEAVSGINRWASLIQWSIETAFGSQEFGNNPGNIESGPGVFAQFASLNDFALAASAVWHQTNFINNTYPNGFEPYRAAIAATDLRSGLLLIGQSPWDAGHYGRLECGAAGCSLVALLDSDFQGVEDVISQDTINRINAEYDGMFGDEATSAYAKLYWTRVRASVVQISGGTLTAAQAQELQEAHDAVLKIEAALKGA